MIKPHQFVILGGVTLLSVLASLGIYASANQWSAGRIEGEALLPGLASQVPNIDTIEITQGGKKLSVVRAGNGWGAKEKGGYPVKPEAVRALLIALTQAELIEAKTAIKAKQSLLELEDPSSKDAKSRGVRLLDKAGKPIADIVLGKTRWDAFGSGRGGIYVRRAAETQTWLATGDPKVTSDITDWVDTKLVEIASKNVTRLTLEHPGEDPVVIEKGPPPKPAEPAKDAAKDAKESKPAAAKPAASDAKFHLAKIPDGQKLKKDVKLDDIIDTFGSLSLEGVKKAAAPPADAKVTVARLEQDGGPTLTIRVRKDGDARWITIEAAGADGDAKKKADALNARFKGWEYKIPYWKGDQLLKRQADLLEKS